VYVFQRVMTTHIRRQWCRRCQ